MTIGYRLNRWEARGDVNWREHGGLWIRWEGGDTFHVIRLEPCGGASREYLLEDAYLDTSRCTDSDLKTCGWHLNPSTGAVEDAAGIVGASSEMVRSCKVEALIATWGVGSQGHAYRVRNAYSALRSVGIYRP